MTFDLNRFRGRVRPVLARLAHIPRHPPARPGDPVNGALRLGELPGADVGEPEFLQAPDLLRGRHVLGAAFGQRVQQLGGVPLVLHVIGKDPGLF
jgi:hypothetical protein